MNITDHGQHDPIPADLGPDWQRIADLARVSIAINRKVRNDAQQRDHLARNERQIAALLDAERRGVAHSEGRA